MVCLATSYFDFWCLTPYQLLAHGRWFSPGTQASSTTKTGRHDIAVILLKVALNTKNQNSWSQGRPSSSNVQSIVTCECHNHVASI
jgi:hypothetical protein